MDSTGDIPMAIPDTEEYVKSIKACGDVIAPWSGSNTIVSHQIHYAKQLRKGNNCMQCSFVILAFCFPHFLKTNLIRWHEMFTKPERLEETQETPSYIRPGITGLLCTLCKEVLPGHVQLNDLYMIAKFKEAKIRYFSSVVSMERCRFNETCEGRKDLSADLMEILQAVSESGRITANPFIFTTNGMLDTYYYTDRYPLLDDVPQEFECYLEPLQQDWELITQNTYNIIGDFEIGTVSFPPIYDKENNYSWLNPGLELAKRKFDLKITASMGYPVVEGQFLAHHWDGIKKFPAIKPSYLDEGRTPKWARLIKLMTAPDVNPEFEFQPGDEHLGL